MLIWVNGPFGGGKTQIAYELCRHLPGSVVCDLELVGFGLQRMQPRALRGDFQDLSAWRAGVREVLDRTLRAWRGPVIVPMTLVVPAYFDEIVGELRRAGHVVHHFALLADPDVVLRRLRARAYGTVIARIAPRRAPRSEAFAVANLERCLDALRDPQFALPLWTDRLTIPEVAEQVAELAGVTLEPVRGGPMRQQVRQAWTSLRHVRWIP